MTCLVVHLLRKSLVHFFASSAYDRAKITQGAACLNPAGSVNCHQVPLHDPKPCLELLECE